MQVAAVTFESESQAQVYARETGLTWPILIDRDRRLYRAYGMDRGGRWQVLGPAAWWAYVKLLVRGGRLHLPTDDIYQLGGDVVINPAGVVRLHYISRTSVDRPAVKSLLAVMDETARS